MTTPSPVNQPSPEPISRREARRQRRAERLSDRGSGWIVGLILIVLGSAFLLQNTTGFRIPIDNWWALFILIPAVGAFSNALRAYREAGDQWSPAVGGSLLGGLILTFVSATFLFELSWTYFGPILIIAAGLGILLTSMLGNKE